MPLKATWIIGDEFLFKTFPTFSAMRDQAEGKESPMLYLFDFYKVTEFERSSTNTRNVLTRIFGVFADAMNTNILLPHFILVIQSDLA